MNKIYLSLIIVLASVTFKIKSQCATPSVVPYFEGFQGITSNNQLPACWAISNPSTCITFTASGSQNGASFYSSPVGTSYFYSNGIQLKAGVIYSVAIWYNTSFNPGTTWSNLSLLLGSAQSPVGQTTLASTPGIVTNQVATALTNTFNVSVSGVYYVSVRATSSGGAGQYLSWDDLSVIAPCTPSYNTPSVAIVASSTVVCNGATPPPTFTATGADTYSWSTGVTTSTAAINSMISMNFFVIGTSTLSSCSNTASILLVVNPTPNVFAVADKPVICRGSLVNLTAYGASSYIWNNGSQTTTIAFSPSVTTTYTVTGINNFSCTSSASITVQVNPLPVITVSSAVSSNSICNGNSDTLTAGGALSYQWNSNAGQMMGAQIIVSPNMTTTYVVTGTDANTCSSSANIVLEVNECTGLNHLSTSAKEIMALPNPFHDEFLLSTGTNEEKEIEITDLSGRSILSVVSFEEKIIVNTRYFCNGIYYVRIKTDERSTILKLIKTN